VPLASQTTMLELGGGLTGRINASVSVFASIMNSRSALPRTRNEAAFEAHSAQNILGESLFRTARSD
jgi:hypothetical protein